MSHMLAKIAGIKMCESFNIQHKTNYDKNTSHFFPALIRKIHEAKIKEKNLILWGSGKLKRINLC